LLRSIPCGTEDLFELRRFSILALVFTTYSSFIILFFILETRCLCLSCMKFSDAFITLFDASNAFYNLSSISSAFCFKSDALRLPKHAVAVPDNIATPAIDTYIIAFVSIYIKYKMTSYTIETIVA